MATIEQITHIAPGEQRNPTPTLTHREAHREFPRPSGIHGLLGDVAWRRLPAAVRTRFGEPVLKVDYVGEFDVVRASIVGRIIAWLCTAIGTPVEARVGCANIAGHTDEHAKSTRPRWSATMAR
jgi:hypothetical protein